MTCDLEAAESDTWLGACSAVDIDWQIDETELLEALIEAGA